MYLKIDLKIFFYVSSNIKCEKYEEEYFKNILRISSVIVHYRIIN